MQAYDRYSYVFNNPVRYTDPTGHCPLCIAFAAITPVGWVAIGVTTAAVVVYFAVPGVREAVTEGIYQAGEAVENGLSTVFHKKDVVPSGLSPAERAAWGKAAELYKKGLDLPGGFQLPKELAEELADLIRDKLSPEEAADALGELEDYIDGDD